MEKLNITIRDAQNSNEDQNIVQVLAAIKFLITQAPTKYQLETIVSGVGSDTFFIHIVLDRKTKERLTSVRYHAGE